MNKITAAVLGIAALCLPAGASAHTGATLDMHGCHPDRVRGQYHCHTGKLAGHSFSSRGEMLSVLESGEVPEVEDKEPSWFSRMLGRGGDDAEESAGTAAGDAGAAETAAATPPAAAGGAQPAAPSAPGVAAAASTSDIEERLRILKGLYNMQLITEDEYAQRRREILAEL